LVGTNILRDDLGLLKKSARWVTKLLSEEQKKKHVWTCRNFVAAVQHYSMSVLDDIVTIDETMVCYHTPKTKKNSQNNGSRRENKAPSRPKSRPATPSRWMAFFYYQGFIYTHIMPGGPRSTEYIVKALGTFMRHFKKKRPEMVSPGEVFLLGQCSGPHPCCSAGLTTYQPGPGPGAPTLLARSGSSGLILFPEIEGGACWHPV
jgi:hypothetical protein